MRRRQFLRRALYGVTAGGCLGVADFDATPTTKPFESWSRPIRSDADDGAASDSDHQVEPLESFEYVVRLNDLGTDPSGAVTAFTDLSDRECGVVETAITERYVTRNRPRWLVAFASATPIVEREGVYYRLETTFPTYEITAEAVTANEVTGTVASAETYLSAVTQDGYVKSSLLGVARREGIELTYVWPELRTFLDEYDAVRYRGDLLSVSTEVTDPGPPYEISGRAIPVATAVRGSVWDASEASSGARKLVRAAGRAQGAYGIDRPVDGFVQKLRSHEYVHLDETFYTATVEAQRSPDESR